jgi:hypothetical protein
MSQRYWSQWGSHFSEQTVGFNGYYYIRNGDRFVFAKKNEIDDLIYQLMRLKRKVEGE